MQKKKKPAQRPVQVPPPSTLKIPKTPEEWKAHWEVLGQGWRTEPEIDEKRQEELAQRRVWFCNAFVLIGQDMAQRWPGHNMTLTQPC